MPFVWDVQYVSIRLLCMKCRQDADQHHLAASAAQGTALGCVVPL